jgi:hypothetical protein
VPWQTTALSAAYSIPSPWQALVAKIHALFEKNRPLTLAPYKLLEDAQNP